METKNTTNKNINLPKLKIKSENTNSKSPKKIKKSDESRNSLSPESKLLKTIMKIDDNKKATERDNSFTQRRRVPKNVNQYRHIIDTMHRDSDVEWIIELRSYRNIPTTNKTNLHTFPPKFYDKDFQDYKQKTLKDITDKQKNPFTLKRNLGEYEHLIDKIGMPANSIQFGFDSTLRTLMSRNKYSFFNEIGWRPLNISPKKDLLNTVLAPINKSGIDNLNKISNYVIRPYDQVRDVRKLIIYILSYTH
jgi:hypothetical protein